MSIYVRDKATDEAVRRLAKIKGTSLTDTIRNAVEKAIEQETGESTFRQRIKVIQDRLAAYPDTGLEADKAFFDELSGDI